MRAKLVIIASVFILVLGFSYLDYSHNVSFKEQGKVKRKAPEFDFAAIDDNRSYKLSDFKGKTILINFWASWCLPCLYEFPMLIDLAARHPDDLVLILLSSDDTKEQAYEFSRGFCVQRGLFNEDNGKLFPENSNIYIAWDENRKITKEMFKTTKYPETIILNSDLTIRKKIIGVIQDEDFEYINNLVSK